MPYPFCVFQMRIYILALPVSAAIIPLPFDVRLFILPCLRAKMVSHARATHQDVRHDDSHWHPDTEACVQFGVFIENKF